MAVSRPPGDTSVIQKELQANSLVTWEGAVQENRNQGYLSFQSFRPDYARGAIHVFPSGGRFIKSTPYSHRSWEMKVLQNARTTGISTIWYRPGGPVVGVDSGVDLGYAWAGNPTIQADAPQDQRNEAVTKALNKIADQKINLGENLATLRQTLGMFTGRAAVLLSALESAKKRKEWFEFFRYSARDLRKKGPLKKTAETYLEYIYGLKPLVDDVYTAYELLKKHAEPELLLHAKGVSQRTKVTDPSKYPVGGTDVWFDEGVSNSKLKCTLWARIDPNWKGLRTLNQYGLLNPLGLAWDLVPYSFVVDWFLPVGPVLYALTAPAGLLFVDGSMSYRVSEVQKLHFFMYTGAFGNATAVQKNPGYAVMTYEGFNRGTLSEWPLPGLWLAPDPLKADRPLKALALAITRLR